MTPVFEFIHNGHRTIRLPRGYENRLIKSGALRWLKQRGQPVSVLQRSPTTEIIAHALTLADELRLPLEEACVFIRRAQ